MSAQQETVGTRRRRSTTAAAGWGAPALLIVFVVAFSIARPDTFFTTGNLTTILSTNSVLTILALSVVVTLVSGQFDLSVGSTLGLSAVVSTAVITKLGAGAPVGILAGLATGLCIGAINGVLVARTRLNSIIVTLATATIAVGVMQAISNGRVLFGVGESFTKWGQSDIGGLRLPVLYAAAVVLVLWFLLEQTPIGRSLYAVGGNPEASRLVGLPVDRLVFLSFLAGGGLAGLAGVVQAMILGAGHPDVGPPLLLPAFAAAFLGATTIRAGRYNVLGAVVAVLLIATGVAGLQLLGVPFFIEPMFNGGALLVAVLFARLIAVKSGEGAA